MIKQDIEKKVDISKKRIETKKIKAEIFEIDLKAKRELDEVLIKKVDTLRLLLQESRVETDDSKVVALNSDCGNFVYIPILTPKAQEIVADKIIELVKKF